MQPVHGTSGQAEVSGCVGNVNEAVEGQGYSAARENLPEPYRNVVG